MGAIADEAVYFETDKNQHVAGIASCDGKPKMKALVVLCLRNGSTSGMFLE